MFLKCVQEHTFPWSTHIPLTGEPIIWGITFRLLCKNEAFMTWLFPILTFYPNLPYPTCALHDCLSKWLQSFKHFFLISVLLFSLLGTALIYFVHWWTLSFKIYLMLLPLWSLLDPQVKLLLLPVLPKALNTLAIVTTHSLSLLAVTWSHLEFFRTHRSWEKAHVWIHQRPPSLWAKPSKQSI